VAFYDRVLPAGQIAMLYNAATGSFYDVTLRWQWSGPMLTLTWPGNGKLLEAPSPAGPWTTNLSSSPVSVSPAQPQRFYRVRTQ
jgi:hypothetical protein